MRFILNRIRSLKFVLRGMLYLLRNENAIIFHSMVCFVLVVLGFCVGLSSAHWIIQILCMGAVLATESLNTAIEKVCDFVHPNYHKKIGEIKDIAAGAVAFATISAFVALCLVYYPYVKVLL
ncbi:diacylglycerol kinase [Capnocytophaga canimorsus]|uniref:diacylglycerol kinase n=1 Tax=Capnocytophaga canimorsus TaxID=28188 RepID=UPI00385D9812